jgi:iron complex outermembrane recepter protein
MNPTIRATVSAILGVAGAGVSQLSLAQSAPATSNDSYALETVVVTAEKREESLKDVPMSITALSGTALQNLQAHDFADYAAMVPGLSLASGQQGQTRLTLRGQNSGGVGSTVAVYIDESPFGSSTALLNGSINTGDFDTWDMKRIEVLRGPQGTLYGANSEGGLLKFVTNAPELGKFAAAGDASGETVNYGGNGWNTHGMVNLPVGDTIAFRLSAFYDDVPGFIDDPALNKQDLNDGRQYGGRASALFAPSTDFSVRLTAEMQTSTYNGTNIVDVNPVTLVPLYGDLKQERAVPEPSRFEYENYNATIDWNVGAFKVLSTTSYGTLDSSTVTDGTPIYGGLAGLFGGDASPLLGDADLKKFTQEIRLTSATAGPLEWLVGGYYTHEKAALVQNLYAVEGPYGPAIADMIQPVVDSKYQEEAGFLDLTYHFNSHFDLQAGGRYAHNSQDATQVTTYADPFGIPPQVSGGSASQNVWTYSVAPSWHFDTATMAYARLATGYRPGGPNVLPPGSTPEQIAKYGFYNSDKTTNVELGIRSTQLDGRFSMDVAIYHVNWKDIQLFEIVEGFGINANGGTARTQGLEWNFSYLPVQGLTFQWTGAFTNAKLTSAAPDLGAASGAYLPYVPKWSTALDGEYKHTAFAGFDGFIGATWSYVGSRPTDFDSSAATPAGQINLHSYSTYEARLGLDNGRYRVTLYGKNLSDSRGITNYSAAGAPYTTVTVTQPLTVGLTVAAKF